MIFAVYPVKLLVKPSLEFSFLLMLTEILENPFAISLVLLQPQTLVSI